jgi:hypothetical protein
MNLFSRWKKRHGEVRTHTHGNKSTHKLVLIGDKEGLFDNIVGFEDVKTLFEMAIGAERPVHLLLCGPPSSGKSLFMSSLTRLEGPIMQLEVALRSLEYLIICLSIGHVILSLTNLKNEQKGPDKSSQSNGVRYSIRTKAQTAKVNPDKDMGFCFM